MKFYKMIWPKFLLVFFYTLCTQAAQQDGQDCLHVYDLDQRTLLSVPKISNLTALPDLVREGFRESCRYSVYFDFDETLAQRVMITQDPRIDSRSIFYLGSPEVRRMMGSTINEILTRRITQKGKYEDIYDAISLLRMLGKDRASYRYYPQGDFAESVRSPLEHMGCSLKICSSLALEVDAAKLPFIKSLGFAREDYIYAGGGDKIGTILQDVLKKEGDDHAVFLVDNNREVLQSACSTLEIYLRSITESGKKVNFMFVFSTQFQESLMRDRIKIAEEIDYALECQKRCREAVKIPSN